jgi:hypothetical protein
LLLGDINVDLLVDSARSVALRDMLEDVSRSIVSREVTNFSATVLTLIDGCATCEPKSIEFFTEHDLIYASYKTIKAVVIQDSSKDIIVIATSR